MKLARLFGLASVVLPSVALVARHLMASRRAATAVDGLGDGSTQPGKGGVSKTTRFDRNRAVALMSTRLGLEAAAHKARRVVTPKERREDLDAEFQARTAQHIADQLGEMKGALMKLGQMASYLDDGLPEPVKLALGQLQQDAPPMDAELARWAVEKELGFDLDSIFADFSPEPIAAASIGQVHRATTHDGREVVVKVQYPGIDDAIAADLDNTDLLGRIMSMIFPGLDPGPLAEELKIRIGEELDYEMEAANQKHFADFYRGHPFIHVPEVFDDLSSKRVLTTEFAEGARFSELETWSQEEQNLAAETMFRFVFRSLYRLRAFNGDPHPGNYLFRPGGHVTFLDFGLVRRFDEQETDFFGQLIQSVLADQQPEFRAALEDGGLLQRDAPFSDAEIHEWFLHFYEIVRNDGPMTLDAEYASETLRRTFDHKTNQILKYANVPPSFALIQRINLGLYALLAHLEATANWRRIAGELWPWVNGEPSTPKGHQEATWLAAKDASGQLGPG